MRTIAALVVVACVAGSARAEEPAPTGDPPPISQERRAAAIALAIVPGILLPGLASHVVHAQPAPKRLALVHGIGIGMIAIGGVATQGSGGSPYFLIPFVPMVVAGAGLVMQSWISEIYVAAGGGEGRPRTQTPWSVELGTSWVHDAYFDRALARGRARVVRDRLELALGGYIDATGAMTAGDLEVTVRLLGVPATGRVVEDGSFLAVHAALRAREDDDVQVVTGEADVRGRLDLDWIADPLHGSFAELSTGGGAQRAAFSMAHETSSVLLGTFAWGLYLGNRGELALFYDHRRDSLAGGIAAWRAAGFVGSAGASLDLRITGPWAARAELEFGSATVSTLALRYQGGPP